MAATVDTAYDTRIQLSTGTGAANQQWTRSGSTLRVLGKCLDATGDSSADDTQLIIWTCHGGANQRWTVPSTLHS